MCRGPGSIRERADGIEELALTTAIQYLDPPLPEQPAKPFGILRETQTFERLRVPALVLQPVRRPPMHGTPGPGWEGHLVADVLPKQRME